MELHLHLDGSLSPDFIAERAFARGIPMPASPQKLVYVCVVDVEVDINVAQFLLLLPSWCKATFDGVLKMGFVQCSGCATGWCCSLMLMLMLISAPPHKILWISWTEFRSSCVTGPCSDIGEINVLQCLFLLWAGHCSGCATGWWSRRWRSWTRTGTRRPRGETGRFLTSVTSFFRYEGE